MPFLSQSQLEAIGFKRLGEDVQVSDKATFYNPSAISIGDHSRIDDFCILSAGEGEILIGRHVHIACYVSLIGKNKIQLEDFSGLSSRVSIYSSSDDFSGNYLTGPTVSEEFTNVIHGDVYIRKHVVIGAGSVILPGVTVEEGSAVGALSLVIKNIPSFCIAAGIPAVPIKERSRQLLVLEKKFLKPGE